MDKKKDGYRSNKKIKLGAREGYSQRQKLHTNFQISESQFKNMTCNPWEPLEIQHNIHPTEYTLKISE